MSDSPACESLLTMCSRILMSSSSAPANSFVDDHPVRLPVVDDADAETAGMDFLAHYAATSFFFFGVLALRGGAAALGRGASASQPARQPWTERTARAPGRA